MRKKMCGTLSRTVLDMRRMNLGPCFFTMSCYTVIPRYSQFQTL